MGISGQGCDAYYLTKICVWHADQPDMGDSAAAGDAGCARPIRPAGQPICLQGELRRKLSCPKFFSCKEAMYPKLGSPHCIFHISHLHTIREHTENVFTRALLCGLLSFRHCTR